jgi:hypothetical protein
MMIAMRPNHELWRRINETILDENVGEVLVTIFSGLSMALVEAGVAETERDARVHLAAMLLSPDDGEVGSLADRLPGHFAMLRGTQ